MWIFPLFEVSMWYKTTLWFQHCKVTILFLPVNTIDSIFNKLVYLVHARHLWLHDGSAWTLLNSSSGTHKIRGTGGKLVSLILQILRVTYRFSVLSSPCLWPSPPGINALPCNGPVTAAAHRKTPALGAGGEEARQLRTGRRDEGTPKAWTGNSKE